MYSQRKKCIVKEIQWELTEKILFQEIFASYESFMKRDHCSLLGRFLTALKASKTQKNSITALQLLKYLILKKGLRHFLTTFKVINAKKGLHHCLKVFNIEEGFHHFLMNLKDFNTEKGLHDFLTTLKVFNVEKGHHHFLETLKGFNFEK